MNRRALARRAGPAALVLLLAAATLVSLDEALRLEGGDGSIQQRWAQTLDALPEEATVLVGFDPDLGTYPEIRPTVRVALAELYGRGANLAFVSLTPEGRALGLAEIDRLTRSGANPRRLADFGFLPGAESALVRLARAFPDPIVDGALARSLAEGGFADIDAVLVVGGNDLGPRAWVEQVLPRIDGVPLLAVAPTILLPELMPYLATGQLDALVGTPRDGATYRAAAELGTADRLVSPDAPSTLAILVGLIVAVSVLGQGLIAGLLRPRGGEQEPR